MKKVILLLLALITIPGYSSAQIGILTLNRLDEAYYGQWYTIVRNRLDEAYYGQWYTMKKSPGAYIMYESPSNAEEVINSLLKGYDQSFDSGSIDEKGDLFWSFESSPDVMTYVYYLEEEEDEIMILLFNKSVSEEVEEFEGSSYWYDRFKKRTR